MFWNMGLSTESPVETILDKETFTLDELLDEDEIIQECKALNGRLISFLCEKAQVKQLVEYIVEEASEDANKQHSFKFPFVSCEIFTCEVDVILDALVEDAVVMDLLFSFLDPERPHNTLLAGYFSKVVVCLFLRKTIPLMNYVRARQDIIKKLVDLIGITSIMEVLIRLIGADEHLYVVYGDSKQWLEDTNLLDMIVDKFSSSDCPEVHSNAAETLCAIIQYAPQGLASKISSQSFIRRLFHHALEDSRPKSVLVSLLSVCISLLDPKKLPSQSNYMYNCQKSPESAVAANLEIVGCMRKSLGNLLMLLDLSSEDHILLTTYGKLQPPLGKPRLKVIEFISVLVAVDNEVTEKELLRLGALERILELFFEYPYNNFLHHHVEQILISCMRSKNCQFVEHLLRECNLIGKILEAENKSTLSVDVSKRTVSTEGRPPPRIGNIGHLTRIANKLIQLANCNSNIQAILQENADWVDWQTNVLLNRNSVENVHQWACGRPTTVEDRTKYSVDDQDRDYDVAALANNFSKAFQYGAYDRDFIDEGLYLDDESAQRAISSLDMGDNHESRLLFTKSNWFALEDEMILGEHSTGSITSLSPTNTGQPTFVDEDLDDVIVEQDKDLEFASISGPPEAKVASSDRDMPGDTKETESVGSDRQPELVEFWEKFSSVELPSIDKSTMAQRQSSPHGELVKSEAHPEDTGRNKDMSSDEHSDTCMTDTGGSVADSKGRTINR